MQFFSCAGRESYRHVIRLHTWPTVRPQHTAHSSRHTAAGVPRAVVGWHGTRRKVRAMLRARHHRAGQPVTAFARIAAHINRVFHRVVSFLKVPVPHSTENFSLWAGKTMPKSASQSADAPIRQCRLHRHAVHHLFRPGNICHQIGPKPDIDWWIFLLINSRSTHRRCHKSKITPVL